MVKPIDFQGMQPKANEISRQAVNPQINDQQVQKKEQIEEARRKKQQVEKSGKGSKLKKARNKEEEGSKDKKDGNQGKHFDVRV